MKKIFAIALAVVMVLSMASAFAVSACATWGTDWSCTADDVWCGQGKVEVVPYVKVNTACGVEFQVSDCASAIKTEEVYFAVKLTVDAYPDPAWWHSAKLDLETTGLDLGWAYDDANHEIVFANSIALTVDGMIAADSLGIDWDADEQKVYYMVSGGFIEDEDATFAITTSGKTSNVIWPACVEMYDVCDPNAVSVCAELSSEYDGYSNDAQRPYNEAGDYFFAFSHDSFNAKGEFSGVFTVYTMSKGAVDEVVDFYVEDGAINTTDWSRASAAFYNKVLADFGLANCGTAACITKANIKANFGWDDEQEDCFAYSDKGASVVDTDCVVAIPKTGDASVLAWLF